MDKINISEKFSKFNDYFNPRIVGEVNGQQVKLVKFRENVSGIIMITGMNYSML